MFRFSLASAWATVDALSSFADIAATINSGNYGWTAQAPEKFATVDDVKAYLGAILPGEDNFEEPEVVELPEINAALPDSFDAATQWPSCSVIGNVRDQSSCGSCWAFASVASYESRRCIATGDDIKYSPEDTAFCSYNGFGCGGGNSAWRWFKSDGVVTGGDYTDLGSGDTCRPYSLPPCAHHVPATAKYPACPNDEYPSPKCHQRCEHGYHGSTNLTSSYYAYVNDKTKAAKIYSVRGEDQIKQDLVTNGPMFVSFTVYEDFPTYRSGVYTHKTGSELGGHAVTLVGYGELHGTPYWKIKNSWNEQWGDGGHFLIKRGSNECGIEDNVNAGTFSVVGSSEGPATLQEMAKHINSLNLSWKAEAPNKFGDFDDVKMLCGTILPHEEGFVPPAVEKEDDGENVDIPAEFDVRTNWPDCASVSGNIRDQSACGSCWAFGSTEAFNDRLCIATGSTALLSTTDTTANCNWDNCFSFGCHGGQPGAAWDWFKSEGVVTGGNYDDIGSGATCAPYPFLSCAHHVPATDKHPACPSLGFPTPTLAKCSEEAYEIEYSADKVKAAAAYSLSGVANIQKDIMQYGSATAAFTVYEDFPTYKSGVYRHTSGKELGGHAIKLLGWGTENGQDYWLVANSWNEEWGDAGTFKIVRGENHCGIEDQVSAGLANSAEATV